MTPATFLTPSGKEAPSVCCFAARIYVLHILKATIAPGNPEIRMNDIERDPASRGSAGQRGDDGDNRVAAFLPLRAVEFYILLALAERDLHGYGIIQATLERSEGGVRLDPGTLYRAITRLADSGLLEEAERQPAADLADRRRRYYAITELGREVARGEAERMAGLVDDARASRLIGNLGKA
jgi:DNA-binding PadR family transcriptional regulator